MGRKQSWSRRGLEIQLAYILLPAIGVHTVSVPAEDVASWMQAQVRTNPG